MYKNQEIAEENLTNGDFIEMIRVRSGTFRMGTQQDGPLISVPDFFLGKYPVTNRQYLTFVEDTDTHHPKWLEEGGEYNIYTGTDNLYKRFTGDLHPVMGVSWQDAVAFCEWLSLRSGKKYRLPSETEWEYAAKGGRHSSGLTYAGSNKLKEVGWYHQNNHDGTEPVGLKLPNELGLHDMSGNVWEWCADHWHQSLENILVDCSAWVEGGDPDRRVVRGGSWVSNDGSCTVSGRNRYGSGNRVIFTGFRLARY